MANAPWIFQRQPLINLGTALGLMLGLAIGMLGAAAWNPASPASRVTTSGQVKTSPTQQSQSLDSLRVAMVSQTPVVADLLRAIAAGTDPRPAQSALVSLQAETEAAVRGLYGQATARDFARAHNASTDQIITYAKGLKAGNAEAGKALNDLDQHIKTMATMLAKAESNLSQSEFSALLRRERNYLRVIAESANKNNLADTYTRQQLAVEANSTLVDLLVR